MESINSKTLGHDDTSGFEFVNSDSFLMLERIVEHDKDRMLADGSKGRVSVKEKLAEMKQKISDQKMPEKPKTKSQEASL